MRRSISPSTQRALARSPAGETSRAAALERCDGDWMFQGGAAVIVQWLEAGRDRNVTCPGESVQLPLWFHQY